jgi:hypothetical protein
MRLMPACFSALRIVAEQTLVQRRTRQLLHDAPQHHAVICRQQRLAPGTPLDVCFRMPQSIPRELADSASVNARPIDLGYTL